MLDIGTKVIVTDAVFSDVWGLTDEQRKGKVVGHLHNHYNLVRLDNGVTQDGRDLSEGPIRDLDWPGIWKHEEPKGARGWSAEDDELEVIEG